MSKKILIVEDQEAISNILSDALKNKGYNTEIAANGEIGVERALSSHPDLILLDLLMPVMDGMTALSKIREDGWGKDVPVIILTNLSADSEDRIENMVENRPRYYLIKSDWDIDDVISKIEEEIGASQS